MAVNDGTRGTKPTRQTGGGRSGRGEAGLDPTEQLGQTPPDIFGFSQSYSTGAKGTQGASGAPADVTVQPGQLDEGLSGVTGGEITDTGLHGSQGASNSGGGESISYTDPFGYLGGGGGKVTTSDSISGGGDWTQANSDGYDSGPTLPALEGNRPTSTGIGEGHVGVKHPHAGA